MSIDYTKAIRHKAVIYVALTESALGYIEQLKVFRSSKAALAFIKKYVSEQRHPQLTKESEQWLCHDARDGYIRRWRDPDGFVYSQCVWVQPIVPTNR